MCPVASTSGNYEWRRNPVTTVTATTPCWAVADRLRVMDATEHPSGEGTVYLAVAFDAFSLPIALWS